MAPTANNASANASRGEAAPMATVPVRGGAASSLQAPEPAAQGEEVSNSASTCIDCRKQKIPVPAAHGLLRMPCAPALHQQQYCSWLQHCKRGRVAHKRNDEHLQRSRALPLDDALGGEARRKMVHVGDATTECQLYGSVRKYSGAAGGTRCARIVWSCGTADAL